MYKYKIIFIIYIFMNLSSAFSEEIVVDICSPEYTGLYSIAPSLKKYLSNKNYKNINLNKLSDNDKIMQIQGERDGQTIKINLYFINKCKNSRRSPIKIHTTINNSPFKLINGVIQYDELVVIANRNSTINSINFNKLNNKYINEILNNGATIYCKNSGKNNAYFSLNINKTHCGNTNFNEIEEHLSSNIDNVALIAKSQISQFLSNDYKKLHLKSSCSLNFKYNTLPSSMMLYPLTRILFIKNIEDHNGIEREIIDDLIDRMNANNILKIEHKQWFDLYEQSESSRNSEENSKYNDLKKDLSESILLTKILFFSENKHKESGIVNIIFLKEIISFIKKERESIKKISIIGYSDSQGLQHKDISTKRAKTIENIFKKKNISSSYTDGFGITNPIRCNTDENGRSFNRRVEIWIKYK